MIEIGENLRFVLSLVAYAVMLWIVGRAIGINSSK